VKLREIFLGKPIHWLPWPLIAALMVWMNSVHFHILRFNMFALALVAVSAAVVAFLLLSSKRDEQITRESFEEGELGGTGTDH
jgi:4-hydroxybenzoate polyprenyltransferase